jgi:hypothetical protein
VTPRIQLQNSLYVCLLLLIALGNFAAGQPPRDRNAVVRPPQPFDAKGRVYSVSRGLIHMLTDTQQPWFVQVDRRTQIQVHGEGGTELISPGVFVRFEAALIGRRIAAGEIAELALFNPAEGFSAGVMADPGPIDEKQLDLGSEPQGQAARPPPGQPLSRDVRSWPEAAFGPTSRTLPDRRTSPQFSQGQFGGPRREGGHHQGQGRAASQGDDQYEQLLHGPPR